MAQGHRVSDLELTPNWGSLPASSSRTMRISAAYPPGAASICATHSFGVLFCCTYSYVTAWLSTALDGSQPDQWSR